MSIKTAFISLTSTLPGMIQSVLDKKAQQGLIFGVSSLYQFMPQSTMQQAIAHEAVVCSWKTDVTIDECRETWQSKHVETNVLLYGGMIEEQQQVPHPALKKRDHFLFPLLELVPRLKHPDGSSIMQACSSFGESKLVRKIAKSDLFDQIQFVEESVDTGDLA